MRRHFSKLDDLLDYYHCSMKNFYRQRVGLTNPGEQVSLIWETAVERVVKSLAREQLKSGPASVEKAHLLWLLSIQGTPIETDPKLNSQGREVIHNFREWLSSQQLVGMAVPFSFPIVLRKQEVLELRTNADLVLSGSKLVRIGVKQELEAAVLATHNLTWEIFDIKSNKVVPVETKEWLPGILKQVVRGMARNIAWPKHDGRCYSCAFKSICSEQDVDSTPEKVRKRLGL